MILYLLTYYLEAKLFGILPDELLKKIQVRRFRKVFEWSRNNSKFYKKVYADAGILNLQIETIEDIEKVPIVDKESMREADFDSVLTSPKSDELVLTTTSGSNGKPIGIYLNKKEHFTSYVRTYLALRGYNPFKTFTVIGVIDQKEKIERQSFMYLCQKYFHLFRRESFDVNTPTDEVIAGLRAKKVSYLSTMPSVFKVIIEELKRRGEQLTVEYAVVAGETLNQELQDDIKTFLQAKIINVYGCMEHPSQAWTKPNGQLFSYPLNSVYIEYVNIFELNGSRYGELVITNLINKTMPFVRYKIGDHVLLQDSYRKMGMVKGRADDIIELDNGTQIFAMQLYKFSRIRGFYQYKFLQKKDRRIFFQAVCKLGEDKELLKQSVLNTWSEHFGEHPIFVEFVDDLPFNTKSGKFKKMEVEK